MARRSNQPALYELIRDRAMLSPRGGAAAPEQSDEPAARSTGAAGPAVGAGAAAVAPARLVRIPVGWIWVTAAGLVAGLVISYVVGFNAGRRTASDARSREIQARLAEEGVTDPLAGGSLPGATPAGGSGSVPGRTDGGAGLRAGSGPDAGRGAAPGGQVRPPAGASQGRTAPAPGSADPRTPGWYYFVIAHPTPERAPELVAFLRDNGLEAAVVPDHNGSLRKVIVLPGLADRTQRSAPEVKAIEAAIRAAGRTWKARASGNRDFGDYYLERARD